MLIHFKFADFPCTHKVLVLDDERLVPASVLLAKLHDKLLAVGNGELRHGKDRPLALFSRHAGNVVLRPQGKDDLLLHRGAFCHFLVHDFERDVIHVEGDMALVLDFRVEIQQPSVCIDAPKQVLHAETLAADVFYDASVLFVDGLHDEPHEHRTFAAQLVQIDLLRVVRTVRALPVVDDVRHLPVEQERLVGIAHVKGVEAAVFGDDAHVRLPLKALDGGFHTDDILRSVHLPGDKVG